jgi:two-component system sensor histidine kinase YesM
MRKNNFEFFLNTFIYKTTIKNRLLTYFLFLVIIPTMVISLSFHHILDKMITERINESSMNDMKVIKSDILQELDRIDDISSAIYLTPQLQDTFSFSKEELDPYFIEQFVTQDIHNVSVVKELNTLNDILVNYDFSNKTSTTIIPTLYMFNRAEYMQFSFSKRVSTVDAIESEKWFLDLPYRSRYTVSGLFKQPNPPGPPQYMIKIAKKLYSLQDRGMRLRALLTLDVGVDDFTKIVNKFKASVGSTLFIVDKEGSITVSQDTSKLGNRVKDVPYIAGIMADKKLTYSSFKEKVNNVNLFVSSYKIEQLGWTIISLSPVEELYIELTIIKKLVYSIIIVFSILGIMIALLLSNSVVYPIRKLVKSMSHVETGNFNIKLDYKRKDEFSYLIDKYNEMLYKIEDLVSKLYITEVNKKDAELKALQAQINPHFLYNTLDSINWMALSNQVPEISKMVTSLSDFFRYSLSKGKSIITLEEEFHQVKSYLAIQEIRFDEKITFDISYPESVKDCVSVKLILQPIVENAIIHGIEKTGDKGYIRIFATESDGTIEISVQDNGVGADVGRLNALLEQAEENKKSYGIWNVNQRIKQYFGESYGLKFYDNEGPGITVKVTIPSRREEADEHP